MFNSILESTTSNLSVTSVMICIIVSLILGFIIAIVI